jgi:phosphonate transport system substrate-binding protein
MSHKFLNIILLLTALAAGCSPAAPTATPTPAPTATPTATGEIVLGDVSDDPSSVIERMQPFADYLAVHLNEVGIGVGSVRVAPDEETMGSWMAAGEVDLYFDSLYPAMLVSDLSGAQPILRRARGDVEYHTVFFALSSSGLESVQDLNGHIIAFDEKYSTSGYMLPLAYLIEAGLNPVEVGSVESSVANDEIGYVFAGEDETIIQWVVSGRVIAGVTHNLQYAEIPEETRAEFTILAETESVPRQVVMASPDLSPEVIAAVQAVLLAMAESEEGVAIMDGFGGTTQFDELPGDPQVIFARMRELYQLVQGR